MKSTTYKRLTENSELNRIFDTQVLESGTATTQAGELVRAISRIGYRLINDGDYINAGYGIETVNPPARFLYKYGDYDIKSNVEHLAEIGELACSYGDTYEDEYEETLADLLDDVIEFIHSNAELESIPASEDMYDAQLCTFNDPFLTEDEYEEIYGDDDDDEDWDDEEDEW